MGNYEVEFDYNKTEMSLLISPNGSIMETETEIKISSLSKPIIDYCGEKYPEKEIKEASMMMKKEL